MRHYQDEQGEIPPMPAPALSLALLFGSIVSWVSGWPGPHGERTNVYCRRERDKPRCTGEIYARIAPANAIIEWRCQACGEDGAIHGWVGTRWDRSPV
jgi:hypothetical protein